MQFINQRQKTHPYKHDNDADAPNIFVVTVDMIPPEFYRNSGCLNDLNIPAWKRLRDDGVNFQNAFCVSPLCGPSRASMYTGRYPYIQVNEGRAHEGSETELRADDVIFPEYLQAVGYETAHIGKSHVGSEKLIEAFDESCSPWNRWDPPVSEDPEYHAYLSRKGVKEFRYKREILGESVDRESSHGHYGGWIEQNNGDPFPMEATYPHYLANRAIENLNSLLQRSHDSDAPVYLQLDLFAPHQPFMIPAGLEEREAELRSSLELPKSYLEWKERDFEGRDKEPGVYQTYRRNWGLYDEEAARDYMVANMLQMEVIDRALDKLMSELTEKGLYEDSLIVLSADHGEMNIEEGLVDKGCYGHPKVGQVPLHLKLPENENAGTNIQQPVCLMDIAPTILDTAGIQPIAHLDGETLYNRLMANDKGREEPFLFESGWHLTANTAIAIQLFRSEEEHYRYVYNLATSRDELYDMNDSDYNNLISDPDYQEVRTDAINLMYQFIANDPRWNCYRQAFELDNAEWLRD